MRSAAGLRAGGEITAEPAGRLGGDAVLDAAALGKVVNERRVEGEEDRPENRADEEPGGEAGSLYCRFGHDGAMGFGFWTDHALIGVHPQ